MLTTLLFDIDDTLLNFRDTVDTVIAAALADVGVTFTKEQFVQYHRINGDLWAQVNAGKMDCQRLYEIRFQRVLDAFGISADGAEVERRFRVHLNESTVPEDGAVEVLQALSERYTLAAASNAPQAQQEHRLAAAGLAPYFTHIFTSGGLGYDKPSPLFYGACLERLGNPPRNEVMMLGDSLTADVYGAQRLGLHACWVNMRGTPAPEDLTAPEVRTLRELKTLLL